MVSRLQVAVLASHNGSNLRALHQASLEPGARFAVVLVVSNNSGSGALAYARDADIPALHLSDRTHPGQLDEAILSALTDHSADLVVTAYYMKKLGPRVRSAYASRIINIHPALLPRHGGKGMYGKAVHESVLVAEHQLLPTVVERIAAQREALGAAELSGSAAIRWQNGGIFFRQASQ